MVSIETFRKLAMSFPNATEEPHFEKTSFRINKKIFASFDEKNDQAVLKLNEIDQSVFCSFNKAIIYPVPNKWGKQGWTLFDLNKLEKEMLQGALETAFNEVTKKK